METVAERTVDKWIASNSNNQISIAPYASYRGAEFITSVSKMLSVGDWWVMVSMMSVMAVSASDDDVVCLVYCCCSYRVLLLHISALLESVVSAVCSLLVIRPRGSLTVTSCPVTQLSDWYTLFQNPSPDYVHVIYCTQEAVYPLWVIPVYSHCM